VSLLRFQVLAEPRWSMRSGWGRTRRAPILPAAAGPRFPSLRFRVVGIASSARESARRRSQVPSCDEPSEGLPGEPMRLRAATLSAPPFLTLPM